MANEIHQIGGILAIVNCEGSVQPNGVGILAEEACTNRVKRSRPNDRISHCLRALVHDIRNDALNTSHHLGGSTPREGQQHHTTRIGAVDDEVCNAMGKGVGLARACTRDDQERSCLG